MSVAVDEFISLPGMAASVSEARAYVAEEIGKKHPAFADVVLLTSEAVTNAILHTASGDRGWINLMVKELDDHVRVEVLDDGSDSEPVVIGAIDNLDATCGRGMNLINMLAEAWGYESFDGNAGGKLWFEVAFVRIS